MDDSTDDRARRIALYMIECKATVRRAAAVFGVSKSTVHKDLCSILPRCSKALYAAVREILDTNKAQRHIRGGNATREKYGSIINVGVSTSER